MCPDCGKGGTHGVVRGSCDARAGRSGFGIAGFVVGDECIGNNADRTKMPRQTMVLSYDFSCPCLVRMSPAPFAAGRSGHESLKRRRPDGHRILAGIRDRGGRFSAPARLRGFSAELMAFEVPTPSFIAENERIGFSRLNSSKGARGLASTSWIVVHACAPAPADHLAPESLWPRSPGLIQEHSGHFSGCHPEFMPKIYSLRAENRLLGPWIH